MRAYELIVNGRQCSLRTGRGKCHLDGQKHGVDIADLGNGDYSVLLDRMQYTVHVSPQGRGEFLATVGGSNVAVSVQDPRSLSQRQASAGASGTCTVRAPMPGKVLAIHVCVGDRVGHNQGLVVVEAMKMQNELRSPRDGTVLEIRAAAGDSVRAGETLIVVD